MMNENENNEEEDVVLDTDADAIEDVEIEETESKFENKLKEVKKKLKSCEAERTDNMDALQRAKADFLNSKKRNDEQLQREVARASDSFIEKLLPLCDSFDMAMLDKESWDSADEKWKTGIEAIHTQLLSILTSYNIEKVGEAGQAFDPNIHEAISVDEESDADTDTVTAVLQSGYKREEELIRPAKVILSK